MKSIRSYVHWFGMLLLIGCVVVGLAGCGGSGSSDGSSSENKQKESFTEMPREDEKTGQLDEGADHRTEYPLQLEDITGKLHTFKGPPQRIVSISPAETEILYSLGLEDQIVALSDYDDYPPETASKPRVGGIINPSEEALIAANPDLIVAGISLDVNVTERLRQLGLTVFQFKADHLDEVYHNIQLLGQITDKQQEAVQLAADMRNDVQEVVEALQHLSDDEKKKVYVEISPGWTVGKGNYLDEMITLAGGVNVAGELEGWTMINEETVIAANPDVILYAHGLVDFDTGKPLDEIIRSRSGWEKINAVQQGSVYGIEENILSRPGPRLTLALKDMARAIYPELFPER